MSNNVSKTDLVDSEFVDADELISDGYTNVYRVVSLVSTTSASKNVVISTPTVIDRLDNVDEPVQVGDIFEIEVGAALGRYTVSLIVDPDNTFRVSEYIPNSAGGSGNLYHPAGATKIGVDPTNLINSDSNDLQNVLEDLDAAIPQDGYVDIAAECIGQVLISTNGQNFVAAMPITTSQGWLVNLQGTLTVGTCEDGCED